MRSKKKALANLSITENKEGFIAKFSNWGFLDNPQMFSMLADIYNKNPKIKITSKKDLYSQFIESSIERNPEYLTKNTFDRLKNILKNAIFSTLIGPDLLTLKSLAKSSPSVGRYIDLIYYVSCALNNNLQDIANIKDDDFLKYLYIITWINSELGGIIKSDYADYIEKNKAEFALTTLKEYIKLSIGQHIVEAKDILIPYIDKEYDIKRLKKLARLRSTEDVKHNIVHNFLNVFNFEIKLEDLKILKKTVTNTENANKINAFITLLENKKKEFNITMAMSLYQLLAEDGQHNINNLSSNIKWKLIDYMMNAFNTEESIKFVSGLQSTKDSCVSFLQDVLNSLTSEELNHLVEQHEDEEDIWRNRIYSRISQKSQANTDEAYSQYPIDKIKDFILSNSIISKEDFYQDIYAKFNSLKSEIEDNRDNEKNSFYNSDNTSKNEEDCRDVVQQKLRDKYGYDIVLTKEAHEANNRVDINIKYKADLDFEVQVECKKDKNPDIYAGIENQLIKKYLSSGVEYGIYLIFYFGNHKNKDEFLEKVKLSVPTKYLEKIKIICIDLTKK